MKKLSLFLLLPLVVLTAWAQGNDHKIVIEANNGATTVLNVDDVGNLIFNNGSMSVGGTTINGIVTAVTQQQSDIDELSAAINQIIDHLDPPEKTFTVNGVSFKMLKVSGGTFQMGATPEQEDDANYLERPVHSVTLSGYFIGETEVTQELWQAVMGQKPTAGGSQWSNTYGLGGDFPAYYISWNDCQAFVAKLNELTGQQFRLPTEAEWEFAARGGNKSQGYKYSGSDTIDEVAWYYYNADEKAHSVATLAPNELGLYDMCGNVFEWCQDWWGGYEDVAQTNPVGPSSGSNRVLRGGSWERRAVQCRVSTRLYCTPSSRDYDCGLRLALSSSF